MYMFSEICHWLVLFESHREKTYLLTCAPNEDSYQPVHPRSLIRVFVVRMKKLCILGYPKCAQWRLSSDCANAQADLQHCLVYMPEVEVQLIMLRKLVTAIKLLALWVKFSADDILKYFFIPGNMIWHFMQTVSNGEIVSSLHEISNFVF